jgi:hypothetical protein
MTMERKVKKDKPTLFGRSYAATRDAWKELVKDARRAHDLGYDVVAACPLAGSFGVLWKRRSQSTLDKEYDLVGDASDGVPFVDDDGFVQLEDR